MLRYLLRRPIKRAARARYEEKCMTALEIVLLDIKTIEMARDALPPHSHIAALCELTLFRLRDEAERLRPRLSLRAA
jgi:hypothetical protein